LHAAGVYDDPNSQDKLFNHVVSSYTPSLTSLLEGLEKPSDVEHLNLLAVTQQDTPNLSSLPGTVLEVNQVQKQMQSYGVQMTRLDSRRATVAAVSQAMDTHAWIHLSCHGKQDAQEPTKSAFFLHDGKLELAEIMKKPLKHARLAYLSACQTASGDAKMPDEAVHLGAGMLTAGYRSVIATLWSIGDKDAPLVAQVFYDHLLGNQEGCVARALHDAVGKLRKEVGETNLISWVPYIHIGH
jgi:CHAT domain-containing protein